MPPETAEGRGRRPRILFVAEAVTLAHVARPLALAERLDPAEYEVVFASEPRFGEPWRGRNFEHRPIRSIPPERFLAALADGSPVYDAATLEGYVLDDLELLRSVGPDVVVGDFRLSLSVGARLAKVPYLAIANAYWSPFASTRFPMPELPISKLLGVPIASRLFAIGRPIGFALHARPLNRVRRAHGLPNLGSDIGRIYTDADRTLYADVPELVPTFDLPATHHYLGPIPWSPPVALPEWWAQIPDDRPTIYATLGSSGRGELLASVVEGLADFPATVLVASAGKSGLGPEKIPANVRFAPYLPGREAARRSSLVVCNGGSPTTHQALAEGTPVLGLASNMDQHLNMEGIVARGAGMLVRSEHATPKAIRRAVEAMMSDPNFRREAGELAAIFGRYDPHARFREVLREILGKPNM